MDWKPPLAGSVEMDKEIKICCVPDCNKKIPRWRVKAKRITCSKRCSNAWNHTNSKIREKIRGKKYGERPERRKEDTLLMVAPEI